MNEQIRELAEQAGVDAGQTIANIICGDDEFTALGNEFNKLSQETRDYIYKVIEQNQQKFAELIVRECIKEVEGLQVSDWNQNWNQAIAHTALHLKEHFGVEE